MEKLVNREKMTNVGSKSNSSVCSSPGSSPIGSDRVLRPMCFVKQLELSDRSSGQPSSYATPRTNLIKTLEKYNNKPDYPSSPPYGRPIAPKNFQNQSAIKQSSSSIPKFKLV